MNYNKKTFTITCNMNERWIPHFLAMLKYMQQTGGLGISRMVSFYSDGDGDFRPTFDWDVKIDDYPDPIKDDDGNRTYDAG